MSSSVSFLTMSIYHALRFSPSSELSLSSAVCCVYTYKFWMSEVKMSGLSLGSRFPHGRIFFLDRNMQIPNSWIRQKYLKRWSFSPWALTSDFTFSFLQLNVLIFHFFSTRLYYPYNLSPLQIVVVLTFSTFYSRAVLSFDPFSEEHCEKPVSYILVIFVQNVDFALYFDPVKKFFTPYWRFSQQLSIMDIR